MKQYVLFISESERRDGTKKVTAKKNKKKIPQRKSIGLFDFACQFWFEF